MGWGPSLQAQKVWVSSMEEKGGKRFGPDRQTDRLGLRARQGTVLSATCRFSRLNVRMWAAQSVSLH